MRIRRTIFTVFFAVLLILWASGCSKKSSDAGSTRSGDSGNPTETVTPSSSDGNEGSETPTATPTESEDSDLSGLLKKSDTGDNFSWYCIMEYNGTKMSYKYWVNGKKEKMELLNDGTSSMILYIDGETNTTYLYDSQNNTALKMVDDSMQNTALKPDDFLYNITQGDLAGYKKKGKENVEGMDCTIYEYEYDNHKIKLYVWDKHDAIVKMETFEDNNLDSSYLLKDYQIGTVSDDMVTIPKDAKVTDVSS